MKALAEVGRTAIITAAMAALVVFLLLLAAELLLRVYHQHTLRQKLPAELRSETRALTWDEIKDEYRIVCLGDSITFGDDLPYGQAYPAVLEDLLRQKYPDLDVAVINVGIRGHTTVQGLARLERDVLWYKPHVVVSSFGLNDGNLGYWPLDPLRERRICGDTSWRGRTVSLLEHSHVYLTLRARARRLLHRLGWQERPAAINPGGEPQPRVSCRGFACAQERLMIRMQQNDDTALFVMTTTPVTEAFRADLDPVQRQRQLSIYDEYNRVVRDLAAKHGACMVDLNQIFANHAHTELAALVAEDGVHLTPAGERVVALSALQALEESGLPGLPWAGQAVPPPLDGDERPERGTGKRTIPTEVER